ncbi:Eco57I restriction-modification methylase domain-containing protein [Candidatus Poriferisocius sp.]|uniref:Eco57I restriction-modification methylase domain-containing protein n=1 Tax=Candidatus Poriferisocius sp. TaxID=3101276 RepID=UPI003B52C1F2
MVILFRLLFVAYAEDKDLLPYRTNGRYADHSLSRVARQLAEDRRRGRDSYDERASDLWDDVNQLWDAVNLGNRDWGVPAYNGGLFSADSEVSLSGAAIGDIKLTNAEFGPALSAVLVDEGPEGLGPVDFRSLSVREFGTIYEGLLESKLSVAQDDLAVKVVKGKEQYVPAADDDDVEVEAGAVYFHNRSGVRKATGSYFTKPFAVEHLLDNALEPALDDHIARLDELRERGDDAALAETFFDFRCADIAMGSAHFLVAAVDRIEARLSAWLTLHPVPAVTAELNRLRETALEALGELANGVEIESSSLLRRQVARHCVYGVDKNRVAVELARLAIWVHTFVPGLPLSFLDHNLVQGDSLTGVGTLDEVVAAFEPDADPYAPSLFRSQITAMLDDAASALSRLAHTSDATKREIDEARDAHHEAQDAVKGARALFDVVTAHRAEKCALPENFDPAVFERLAATAAVAETVKILEPVHFPAAFPEVFLRERPGFDCLMGNPPWEQVVVQEHVWWGTHLPGIRSLPINRMNDAIERFRRTRPDLESEFELELALAEEMRTVLRNAFPGLGSGRTDYYQVFAWANLNLASEGGRIGLVLPHTAVNADGMAAWRNRAIGLGGGGVQPVAALGGNGPQSQGLGVRGGPQFLHGGAGGGHEVFSTATCLNTRQWAFDGVDGRYTVTLIAARKLNPRTGPRGWL